MTKTIETIKRTPFRGDVLDSHIADTYFYQKTRPKIRKKKAHSRIKDLKRFAIPVTITAFFVIAIVMLAPVIHGKYYAFMIQRISAAKTIKIMDRGVVNKDIIKNYEFRGYAKKETIKTTKDAMVLDNPKKYNWADLAMNFSFPMNLTNRSLSLSLRGNVGGERVSVVLRDASNKTYRINDLYLSSRWSDKLIKLNSVKGDIDLARIEHMRIEYGYVGESARDMDSPIDVTVYIKNINLLKET
jgi:hypothetical protein